MFSRKRLLVLIFTSITTMPTAAQDNTTLPPLQDAPNPQGSCDSYSIQTLPRLSFKQQACIYRDQLLTGNAISGAMFSSAISTWGTHKPSEWPQGMKGFGMRFGTNYTQGMAKTTGTFLVGAILREDPRALPPDDPRCQSNRKQHHHYPAVKFWPRLGQSVMRVIWTHNEACRDVPAVSRLAGSFSSGFVQLAWLPPSERNVARALRGSANAFGGYVTNSVFNEFQKDLFGWVGRMFATGKPPKRPSKNQSKDNKPSGKASGIAVP